jgi:hypothetical protein
MIEIAVCKKRVVRDGVGKVEGTVETWSLDEAVIPYAQALARLALEEEPRPDPTPPVNYAQALDDLSAELWPTVEAELVQATTQRQPVVRVRKTPPWLTPELAKQLGQNLAVHVRPLAGVLRPAWTGVDLKVEDHPAVPARSAAQPSRRRWPPPASLAAPKRPVYSSPPDVLSKFWNLDAGVFR